MPYLLEEKEDIGAKREELENYGKALKEGGLKARKFSVSLDGISEREGDFKDKWGDHTNEVISHIKKAIVRLEKDLVDLAGEMQKVKSRITSMRAQGQSESNAETTNLKAELKRYKSEMKQGIKEAKRESERQIKTDKTVARKTDSITSKTDNLMTVWNLISNDITAIETQLKAGVRGESPVLFRARVAVLKWQYSGLAESLRDYAAALFLEPTDNSGRPLVTRLMSLLTSNK